MPTYKLTYFDIAALGETLRFLFAYGAIPYEDIRIKQADWPALKSKTPFGQLPVLEIDGKKVTQSLAIARYLAKKVGLKGKTDWEELEINIAVDIINDFRASIAVASYEPNEELKAKRYETLHNEYLPFILPRLETMVKENRGYFALGRLTLADIFFVSILKYVNFMAKIDVTENYQRLQDLVARVESVPNIKKWLEVRPVSEK